MIRTDIMSLLGKTIQGIGYDDAGNICLHDSDGKHLMTIKEDSAYDEAGERFDTSWIE